MNEIFQEFIDELIIDKDKISKTNEYFFLKPGKHRVIAFLRMEKIKNADLMFYNITNLVSIKFSNNFFSSNLKSVYGLFKNCINLTYVNFNGSFSDIKNFSFFFQNCISLTSLDLSNIVTREAINISYMFSNCSSLQLITEKDILLSLNHSFNFFRTFEGEGVNVSKFDLYKVLIYRVLTQLISLI